MNRAESRQSALILLAAAWALAGCDYYAKPYRALPESFSVKTLDGGRLAPQTMRGKPWIIHVWLPG